MTIDQALGILNPQPRTLEGLKKAFKAYALKYHPDRNPGFEELMKLGNAANDLLKETAYLWTKEEYHQAEESKVNPIDEEIARIYEQVKFFPGITITLSGVWLWITGNTKPLKDEFKKMGFMWCPKKCAWSWKPQDYKRKFRHEAWSFDRIYGKYGKQEMQTEERIRI